MRNISGPQGRETNLCLVNAPEDLQVIFQDSI